MLDSPAGLGIQNVHPFTITDCAQIEEKGFLIPGRYELLEGVVFDIEERSELYYLICKRSFFALSLIFGQEFVRWSSDLTIDEKSRLLSDIMVTTGRDTDYLTHGTPTFADARLITEVSDTTIWRDQNIKTRIYGRAGLAEYWVLDVNGRKLVVHRQPTGTGYASVQELDESQSVSPLAAPNASVKVSDLLP